MIQLRTPCTGLGLVIALGACAFRPDGESAERERAVAAGLIYTENIVAPDLSATPGADEYLQYAFYKNLDLQARYWEWRSAIEQIPQDSSPPNAAISFSYLFSRENMTAWNRTTLGISNDPMTNLPFPSKLSTAGRRALEEARAAGFRFEAAKFQLQRNVLTTYYDLALLAELIRIAEENVLILRQITELSAIRVQSGMSLSQDLTRAQTELDLVQNDLMSLRSRAPAIRSKMAALLNRDSDATVPLPVSLPLPRPLSVPDADLIRIGSERSPDLEALAREVAGREDALELAKQAYIPDINISFSITGTISQLLGGMIVAPTRLEAIRAGIEQARANLRAVQAARAQYERDLASSFVLNLAVLRNDERQIELFESTVLPRARQTIELTLNSFSSSRAGFLDVLDAQRTFLEVRRMLAEIKTDREKTLVTIETWSAIDVNAMTAGRFGFTAAVRGGATGAMK